MIISPSRGWSFPNLRELWEYRELVYFFAWRDVKVRYKQTVLGAAWAGLQPFFMMVVFTIFFGTLAQIPSDGLPYPIFAFSALVPWTYFANVFTQASNSMVLQRGVITKVYFPRLAIPMSSMISGLPDFAIAFVLLIGMMLFFGITPTITVLLVPVLILLAMVTALGIGLWAAALNAIYRDVRYAVPFFVQFWLLATPIAYPSSLVPDAWRPLYGINPMAGVVEGFRWALLGSGEGLGSLFIVSVIMILLVLVTGLFYFRRMERKFADVV